MQMENSQDQAIENDYKVLLSYIKDFLDTRRFILTILIVFLVLGVLTVIFTPKTYSSQVTFIAQGSSDSKSSTGLKGIAKLLSGVGASSATENTDIPIFLYPRIVESLYFKRELYNTPIQLKGGATPVTFKEYATTIEKPSFGSKVLKYTIGLPGLLFSNKSSAAPSTKIDSLVYSSLEERKVIESLKDKIEFSIDEEDGTLNILVTMEDEAVATTQLAQSAQHILQKEIIKYRIAKAKEKYTFIEDQYQQKKEKFEQIQERLAAYNDRNLFNATQSSLIRKQQLENESALFYTIYSDLEMQLLSESIKIQEDTPTFTIINPAVVPLEPDDKGSIKIIVLYLVLGFFIAIFRYVFVVAKRYVKSLWEEV